MTCGVWVALSEATLLPRVERRIKFRTFALRQKKNQRHRRASECFLDTILIPKQTRYSGTGKLSTSLTVFAKLSPEKDISECLLVDLPPNQELTAYGDAT